MVVCIGIPRLRGVPPGTEIPANIQVKLRFRHHHLNRNRPDGTPARPKLVAHSFAVTAAATVNESLTSPAACGTPGTTDPPADNIGITPFLTGSPTSGRHDQLCPVGRQTDGRRAAGVEGQVIGVPGQASALGWQLHLPTQRRHHGGCPAYTDCNSDRVKLPVFRE